MELYYRPDIKCYFFDRNRQFFEHVIQYYMCGTLNLANNFDSTVARQELNFFKIDPDHSAASIQESVSVAPRGWRENLFMFLNEPTMNCGALAYCILDVVLVCCALGMMMMETDKKLLPDVGVPGTTTYNVIHIADKFFMAFFTFDVILRIISWPSHAQCGYFSTPMNMIDLVALSPYYVQHGVSLLSVTNSMDVVSILRASRLLRMVRIFRFNRLLG